MPRRSEEKFMAGLLDSVDLRTQMAGQNRLELLLFRLTGRQRFGINVFKVREVIQCPPLTRVPHSKSMVCGIAHLRGNTVSIIDLSMALGKPPAKDLESSFVIVTEYNRSTQGFLVCSVDRIINMKWEEIVPPPAGVGGTSYLTAVTKVDNELVEIVDVEKVLSEVMEYETGVSEDIASQLTRLETHKHVLVVDDSGVARKQITRALDQVGVAYSTATNGREALELLCNWADNEPDKLDELALVITDIEMPEMDGYTLTSAIKKDPRLAGLYVLLHSSLSGVFNESLVKKVGADRFLAKYNADDLTTVIMERVQAGG
jgi:two-component system chemotaxis response regulator CheV